MLITLGPHLEGCSLVFFRNHRAGLGYWASPCAVELRCQGLVYEVWSRGDKRCLGFLLSLWKVFLDCLKHL